MKNRTALMLISLLLALATAGAAFMWLKSQSGITAKKTEKIEMWIAKEEIAPGTQITDKMIEKVSVPKDQLSEGIISDPKEIVDRYAKDTILKGESFPAQRLYTEDDRLLSMRLDPGYRAFSISATRFSGVADLLKAGDRVDVFVFLEQIEKDSKLLRSDMAQILLQNVEVLAVRKETNKESTPPEKIDELYAVTVAVPVKAVEKLILAEETGMLKLALRPIDDTNTYASYGVIWKELLLDPNLNIRDFDPQYGTVTGTDQLTIAQPIQQTPAQPEQPAEKSETGSTQQNPVAQSPVAAEPVKKAAYTYYTVRPGDTLMSISRKYFNGSASHYDDIMRLNRLSDQTIKPGQKLKIPMAGR